MWMWPVARAQSRSSAALGLRPVLRAVSQAAPQPSQVLLCPVRPPLHRKLLQILGGCSPTISILLLPAARLPGYFWTLVLSSSALVVLVFATGNFDKYYVMLAPVQGTGKRRDARGRRPEPWRGPGLAPRASHSTEFLGRWPAQPLRAGGRCKGREGSPSRRETRHSPR